MPKKSKKLQSRRRSKCKRRSKSRRRSKSSRKTTLSKVVPIDQIWLEPKATSMKISKSNILSLVLEQLRKTRIPKSERVNVGICSQARAMSMGHVLRWGQWQPVEGKYNTKFPKLYELLKWLIALHYPEFRYTTIQINYGFACKKHIDKNNVGPSYTISLGDFVGGELVVDDGDCVITHNTHNKLLKFNGRLPHWVLPFQGERYSLVFFTHTFNGLIKKWYKI